MSKQSTCQALERRIEKPEGEPIQRKKAENALRETEEILQAILDNSMAVIYLKDIEGRYLQINARYASLFHISREQIVGKTDYDVFPRESADTFRANDLKVLERNAPIAFEEMLPHDDGMHHYISRKFPLHRTDGETYAVGGISTDITDLRRAEEGRQKARDDLDRWVEERTAEALYQSLIDSSEDAVVICDTDGKTKYISEAFTRLFGWTLDEVKGKEIPFLPEPERETTSAVIKELMENGTPCHGFETKRYTRDRRLLDISMSASRYDDHEGKPAGILVVLHSITRTGKHQAHLRHAQKMEFIGTISSGMAHNFRNILGGISANSQLIELRYGDNEKLCEIAKRIKDSVRKGARLVDGLMQFSSKEGTERFEVLNLAEVIRDTSGLVSESFDDSILIRADVPAAIPVRGDHLCLKQMIMNLCTNARDAMPDGGQLRIEARQKGERAEVVISDTGHGMDKETLGKCFDPFFTTKSVDKGTGLGLSRAYGIAKEHGGDMHAFSELGKGSTFKLYLPIAKTKGQAKGSGLHSRP
jgi:PAS domain S-box-containing protein